MPCHTIIREAWVEACRGFVVATKDLLEDDNRIHDLWGYLWDLARRTTSDGSKYYRVRRLKALMRCQPVMTVHFDEAGDSATICSSAASMAGTAFAAHSACNEASQDETMSEDTPLYPGSSADFKVCPSVASDVPPYPVLEDVPDYPEDDASAEDPEDLKQEVCAVEEAWTKAQAEAAATNSLEEGCGFRSQKKGEECTQRSQGQGQGSCHGTGNLSALPINATWKDGQANHARQKGSCASPRALISLSRRAPCEHGSQIALGGSEVVEEERFL